MKVEFKENKHHAYARGLYQYDFGQTLEIVGLELPSVLQIDFALDKMMGDAISMDAYTDEENVTHVNIPDSLLGDGGKSTNYSIWAYLFVTDEEKGETVAFIQIDVNARPKGGGHDTPEERPYFEQIIAQVKEYGDNAIEAATGAQEAREGAATAKNEAQALSDAMPIYSGAPQVGQIYQVSAIGEDGKVTIAPVDMPTGGAVDDVQVNGASIVADGVTSIPLASTAVLD